MHWTWCMVLVSRLCHHHHCHPGRKLIGVDRKIGGTRKRVLGKYYSIIEGGCDEIVGVENPEMINLSMGKEAQACFFCPYDNNLLRSPPLIESTPTHDLSSYHWRIADRFISLIRRSFLTRLSADPPSALLHLQQLSDYTTRSNTYLHWFGFSSARMEMEDRLFEKYW